MWENKLVFVDMGLGMLFWGKKLSWGDTSCTIVGHQINAFDTHSRLDKFAWVAKLWAKFPLPASAFSPLVAVSIPADRVMTTELAEDVVAAWTKLVESEQVATR
jgi:hypothetical protein